MAFMIASGLSAIIWLLAYATMPVMGCSLSRAAAVNWIGECTLPLALGEQMATILSCEGLHCGVPAKNSAIGVDVAPSPGQLLRPSRSQIMRSSLPCL